MPEYKDGEETGRALITKDWLEAVYTYSGSVRDWIEAATSCLKAGR